MLTITASSVYAKIEYTGDALVKSCKHIFLVTLNYQTPPSGSPYNEPYVVAYEQKPPQAQLTFWTYKEMSKQGYTPISYF